MFKIDSNGEKQRIYITLAGHLEADERKAAMKACAVAMRAFTDGFDLVHDLTGLHATDAEGLKDLVRLQASAKIMGVRRVVRVAGLPLSRVQLERMARETGWKYETAPSVEAADLLLDAPLSVEEPAG
jgi:hypothetical protein